MFFFLNGFLWSKIGPPPAIRAMTHCLAQGLIKSDLKTGSIDIPIDCHALE